MAKTVPGGPTITAVSPNMGSSAGGWVFSATLSPAPASVSSVTINGVACTNISYASPIVTATAPAYSGGANGSTIGQTVSVTTPLAVYNSSNNQTNYFYLPSNTAFSFAHRGDALVTLGTGVSNWGDISGNGNAWVQATGAKQPTVSTNFNGSGLNSLTTNGTNQNMAIAALAAGITGACSLYWVGNYVSVASSPTALFLGGTGRDFFLEATPTQFFSVSDTGTLNEIASSVAADNNAHVHSTQNNGSSAFYRIDSITTSGTINNSLTLNNAILGAYTGPAFYGAIVIAADILYAGSVSSADDLTIYTILKTIYGTP